MVLAYVMTDATKIAAVATNATLAGKKVGKTTELMKLINSWQEWCHWCCNSGYLAFDPKEINGHHNQEKSIVQGEEPRDVAETILAWILNFKSSLICSHQSLNSIRLKRKERKEIMVAAFSTWCSSFSTQCTYSTRKTGSKRRKINRRAHNAAFVAFLVTKILYTNTERQIYGTVPSNFFFLFFGLRLGFDFGFHCQVQSFCTGPMCWPVLSLFFFFSGFHI